MVVGLSCFLCPEVMNGEKLFALKVKPPCTEMHGVPRDDPKKIKGDLDMRSRESLLLGGERMRTS